MSGERVLAGLFGLFGLFFAVEARDLTYMDEFAPGAGFLPFWLGLLLVALVIGFLFTTRPAGPSGDGVAPVDRRKVAAVALGLVACIAAIEWLGFAVSIAAYLLYLVRAVERRGWGLSAGVAVGTTLGLYLIFQAWLKVPLPRGPWGF